MATTNSNPKPKRRWIAFRLRTLLIVVAVVCAVSAPLALKVRDVRNGSVRSRSAFSVSRHLSSTT